MLVRKIALNTIISVAARVIGTALALVTIGLITRYLSKTEWGEYSLILTFGGIFGILAEWGLYQLMVREISKPGADESAIASNIFTMRLLISLFVFLLAPLVSLAFPYSTQVRLGILAGMGGFWFLSGSQVLVGVFQKYLKIEKAALAEVAGRAAQLVAVFFFIRTGSGFFWIIFALILGGFLNFLINFWLAQKHIKIRLRFDSELWKKSLKQSLPLAVSNILVMIYFSTDALFLSIFKPVSDVGIYRLPYKVLESLIFFPSMFVGLIMPLLSKTANYDWAGFKKIFQRSQDILIIFALPMILGTLALSPTVIGLLGGNKYSEAVPLLNILIVAVGIIFFGTLFSFSLIAIEKQKTLLIISGVGAVFNVLANIIFIPLYSYYAAATTTVLTEALVAFLMLMALQRSLKFRPSFLVFWKSLLAAVSMALILLFFKDLNVFILLAFALSVYFVSLYALKGFSFSDLLVLIKKENED